MVASGLFMAALGVVGIFAAPEILVLSGQISSPISVVAVQMLAAVYFGFGLTNYMARGITIGGIYAKPLAMGNAAHFGIGFMTLARVLQSQPLAPAIWVLTAMYAVFTFGFYKVAFTHPAQK